MLNAIVKFVRTTFPTFDQGIDLKNPDAALTDASNVLDLSAVNGWLERIGSITLEASRLPNAYQVLPNGHIVYDQFVIDRIVQEFDQLDVHVGILEVETMFYKTYGSSEFRTRIAHLCNELHTKRKTA